MVISQNECFISSHNNYVFRRGEEHSFILKLATTANKDHKGNNEAIPYSRTGAAASNTHKMSSISEGVTVFSPVNQFAILVSCRCNYTGTMETLDDIIAPFKIF